MLLRRGFFGWLVPAAFVLPLWLFAGWVVTGAGGWAFLWLVIAMPGLFVWQLILALLTRARGTVRAHRAVSWWDVLGFGVWHLLVIALGFFSPVWWAPVLVMALATGVALLWLQLWQLWREARPARSLLRTSDGLGFLPPPTRASREPSEIFVVTEQERSRAS
jgi:hypothetical protein